MELYLSERKSESDIAWNRYIDLPVMCLHWVTLTSDKDQRELSLSLKNNSTLLRTRELWNLTYAKLKTVLPVHLCDKQKRICPCNSLYGGTSVQNTFWLNTHTCWWLVRVTLVVDWLFLTQNFGQVVGTYEGLFVALWMCIGWWFYFEVVGTPHHYMY